MKNPKREVNIALVGKYTELPDAYKSIAESFVHAGAANHAKVRLQYVNSEDITRETIDELLGGMCGILVAPGFGHRGIEGKLLAAEYARTKRVPYFGIGLGMQCAAIEFARNVLGYAKADSAEMEPTTPYPVVAVMEEQKNVSEKGGTMRLGAYPCTLDKKSKAAKIYGTHHISERHRHRYELNNKYMNAFEEAGMKVAGVNPSTGLVEVVELEDHPWFIGVSFHPEYRSTALNPHPLFVSFVKSSLDFAQ